jgi:acyl-CoA synthetase (NDP forming)
MCRFGKGVTLPAPKPVEKIHKLLHPESIGIIGVSATKMNFGRIMLNNIISSGYDKSRIMIIKPGDDAEIDGVKCVPDLKSLDHKLDLFVVAVSAEAVFGLVDEVIETNAAETVMLIPGGLGETRASREPARKMIARMQEAHRNLPDGGPLFLGGNCLGVVSHPGNYDSWFVPQERLPRKQIRKRRNTAFISQSGAFMITRLSKNPWLDPAYMIATGNQNDISHSDMINYFADHDGIDVIGLYIEGFKDLDGLAFASAVRRAVINGKDIVVYKAGQTDPGKNATMGHTASIAGDYNVCVSILTQAGAMVAREFSEFADLVYAASYLHHKKIGGNRLGAVSGAGFETVGMADNIQAGGFSMEMASPEPATLERLGEILKAKKLDALMEVRNPFDINPGADDEAHLECTAAFIQDPNVDAVVVGMDPISPMIMGLEQSSRPDFDINNKNSQANTLPKLVESVDKPIIGIIEGGTLYDAFAARLMNQEVCIFRATERGVHTLARYIEGRLHANMIRSKYA